MAYFQIADFRGGIDLRRAADLAPPGTLRVLRNAFVNAGGEVEKRPAFVKDAAITALIQGAEVAGRVAIGNPAQADDRPIGPFPGETDGEVLFCGFQDGWAGGQDVLAGVTVAPVPRAFYTKLLDVAGAPIAGVTRMRTASVTEFDGNLFLIASSDGVSRHFLVAQAPDNPVSSNQLAGNPGEFAVTHRQKVYAVSNIILRASHLGEPTNFDIADPDSAGAFETLLRGQEDRIGRGRSIFPYFGQLAVFGAKGIQFWAMDPDPAMNQYLRTVPRDGIVAPRAARGFGDGDVVFLAKSGVRSLQARDSSNLAKIGDVGSPIDSALQPVLRQSGALGSAAPEAQIYIHALTGQLWLVIGSSIYVLSNHPESKVLAWSEYVLPSPTPDPADGWIEDAAEIGGTLMVRNRAREIFVLGGPLYDQYDATAVVLETPHLGFGTPGHQKKLTGIDVSCTGSWRIEVSLNAQNVDPATGAARPIAWEEIARINGSTHEYGRIPIEAEATHIAVRATSTNDGPATLGEILVHFEQEDAT